MYLISNTGKNGLYSFLCPYCYSFVETRRAVGLKQKGCQKCRVSRMKGAQNPNYRHGYATNGFQKLYLVWADMKRRSTNPNHSRSKRYYLRGIRMCNSWNKFEAFESWAMGSGYREGLTIDRIDNDGDYTPENCRWVTNAQNCRNSSRAIIDIETARRIKSLLHGNMSVVDIVKSTSCSEHIVRDIKREKTWRNI